MLPLPLDRTPYAFTADGEDYVLVRGPAFPEAGYVRVSDRQALALVEGWRNDGQGRLLRRMCMELGLRIGDMRDPSGTTATQAGRALADSVHALALFIRLRPSLSRVSPAEAVIDLRELVEAAPDPADELAPRDPEHWLHLTFVDEDGAPLPEVDCRIELPDGRIHQGRTDADGVLWVERIARPGTCPLEASQDGALAPASSAKVA